MKTGPDQQTGDKPTVLEATIINLESAEDKLVKTAADLHVAEQKLEAAQTRIGELQNERQQWFDVASEAIKKADGLRKALEAAQARIGELRKALLQDAKKLQEANGYNKAGDIQAGRILESYVNIYLSTIINDW